ncbi:hypothetical protein L249_8126, partial [Ophiocordyceps polyrhachis-furcata BCC 54312]
GGYGYGTATPYSGYGRTGRTGRSYSTLFRTGKARRAFFSNTISLRGGFPGSSLRCFVIALLFVADYSGSSGSRPRRTI